MLYSHIEPPGDNQLVKDIKSNTSHNSEHVGGETQLYYDEIYDACNVDLPGEDQSVNSFDEHCHDEVDLPEFQKFSRKQSVEVENIVSEATKHNVVA
jgi:hypothetical protein